MPAYKYTLTMARPHNRQNKIINIGISWHGFLLAVLSSLIVALALLWIKHNNNILTQEPFALQQKAVKSELIYSEDGALTEKGARVAVSICKPAESDDKVASEEPKPLFPSIPCGAILDREYKPRDKQSALAILLTAKQFVNIFNYNSDPIASNNLLYRREFINLIATQCQQSGESKYKEIRDELSKLGKLDLQTALSLLNMYDCVRSNCETMVWQILKANSGTIRQVVERAKYSIVSSGNTDKEQSSVSLQPGELVQSVNTNTQPIDTDSVSQNKSLEARINSVSATLTPKFSELDQKMEAIMHDDCTPLERCIKSSQAAQDADLSRTIDTLVKSYGPLLAINMIETKNEVYSNPDNIATINEQMISLPPSEKVVNKTPACSSSDYILSFGAKPSLA